MTWIKICGITNLEDALTAVEAGADALGFVFYEKSPRRIAPEVAQQIAARLPPQVEKVGVFVNASTEYIDGVVQQAGLTAVQFHGGASFRNAGWNLFQKKIKRYLVLPASELLEPGFQLPDGHEQTTAVFLDSSTSQMPGGTGKVFDWEKAEPVVRMVSKRVRVVVAGGLNSANVANAIRILKPWGVDVSSGVEARPGKKDPDKVHAFIAAVRASDQSK